MKRVWLLTPMDVPDDTDPARVAEVFNSALNDDDGLLCQWGDWLPGDAVLADSPNQVGSGGSEHVRVYAWNGGSGPANDIVLHAHGMDEPCNADCDYSGMGTR